MRLQSSTSLALIAAVWVGCLCGCGNSSGVGAESVGGAGTGESAGTPADRMPDASRRPSPSGRPVPAECGTRLEVPAGAQRLSAQLPARIRSVAGGDALAGEVTWPWVGGPGRAVGPASADVLVVDGQGRLVAVPGARDLVGRPVELVHGKSLSFRTGTLVTCTTGGTSLPAGVYQVYVSVVLHHDGGSATAGFGGPWSLTVVD